MKAFITGITGFVGSHLADYILSAHPDYEVHGLIRWRSPMDNILSIKNSIQLHYGDLRDQGSLIRILEEVKPDKIFHLAAQSYVPTSFNAPVDTLETNIIGTTNLLEAIRINKLKCPIHICSSSEVYGQVTEKDIPINEDCPLRPASPYAVGKVGEDMVAMQYFLSYGIKTIRTRMFTHSVSRWTPVIIRKNKKIIDIKYISEIRKKREKGTKEQLWDLSDKEIEVWNDGDWTKIKHLSCHPINNHRMLEITCRMGTVDTTDNHSIITDKGEETDAGKLKIGDRVKISSLPKCNITSMNKDLAWMYGLFVAEGCQTNGKLRIDNTDIKLLEKTQNIWLKYFGAESYINISNKTENGPVYRINIKEPQQFLPLFASCYGIDGNKKIPKIILNGDRETKLAFLQGYNLGDGETTNKVLSEFYRFKTKSPLLALGLCMLVENVLEVKYRVHTEHREDKRYYEIRCLNQTESTNGEWLTKEDNEITKITEIPYEGEVWDFETENHWFHAGIGGNIVHNTGPRRGKVFVVSAFAKQIAQIEAGLQDPIIKVGNLESVRTFADVRDTVKAYWLLLEKCGAGEVYNIGGDRTMTVGKMLEHLISISTCKDIAKIEVDPKLLRPSDVTLQIPDCSKFKAETGWEPTIPFEQTMEDTLNYWRNHVC